MASDNTGSPDLQQTRATRIKPEDEQQHSRGMVEKTQDNEAVYGQANRCLPHTRWGGARIRFVI
jgi:hypothetical protein